MKKKIKKINKSDIYMKNLFRSKKNFCSIVNGILFNGQSMIKPSMLSPLDSDLSSVIGDNDYIERRRDLVWLLDFHGFKFILGIENQTYIDDSMIVRVGTYDFLQYLSQIIANKGSGGKREIYPVKTLVLYYGDKEWTPPTSMRDYFTFPEEFKGLFNNWSYPLYNMNHFDYRVLDEEELRMLIEGVQRINRWNKDPESLKGWVVPKNVALGIVAATGQDEFFECIEIQEGEINMSESFKEFYEEAIETGKNEGKRIGLKEGEIIGRKEGIKEGIVQIITRQLNQILGEVSLNLTKQIESSSEDKLVELSLSIMKVHSEKDVLKLLTNK